VEVVPTTLGMGWVLRQLFQNLVEFLLFRKNQFL
jgi:hypothetical protein